MRNVDPCNRRELNAQEVLDLDMKGAFRIERKVMEDLLRFER